MSERGVKLPRRFRAVVKPTPLVCALLCTASALGWQALKVRYEFGGNWGALFNTGRDFPPPPELAWEHVPVVSPTTGYDGQFYHYIAHDPFFRHGLARYIDDPRRRYERILVPLAAYVLVAGHQPWIDFAVRAVVLLFVFLGAWWTTRYALAHGGRARPVLLFALLPATVLSVENLTVDVALAALGAAFLLQHDGPVWKLFPILALAPLARETGVLLVAGSMVWALWRSHWRRAAVCALAAVPWAAWTAFVYRHTPSQAYPMSPIPFYEAWRAVLYVRSAVPGALGLVVTALDAVAVAGSVLAVLLGLYQVRRGSAVGLACAGFGILGLVLQRPDVWDNYHAHTRVLSPLYLWLSLGAYAGANRVQPPKLPNGGSLGDSPRFAALPFFLVLPRLALGLIAQLRLFF